MRSSNGSPNAAPSATREPSVAYHELVDTDLEYAWNWYAVRYRILDDRLLVMAVSHQHRHPDSGTDREA